MKKRIFLGIPATKQIKNKVKDFYEEEPASSKMRKIKGENLHITLIPPWYVEEGNEQEVVSVIQNAKLTVSPFTIKFNTISYGPDPKKPRLVWVTGEKSEELVKLKASLGKILGEKPERRMFLPHLTIARFNPKDFKNFQSKRINKKVNWTVSVDSFVLYESKLRRAGAEYEVLKNFNLERSVIPSGP